jgi:hypothetical protein
MFIGELDVFLTDTATKLPLKVTLTAIPFESCTHEPAAAPCWQFAEFVTANIQRTQRRKVFKADVIMAFFTDR